jgi:hypothetical protein
VTPHSDADELWRALAARRAVAQHTETLRAQARAHALASHNCPCVCLLLHALTRIGPARAHPAQLQVLSSPS